MSAVDVWRRVESMRLCRPMFTDVMVMGRSVMRKGGARGGLREHVHTMLEEKFVEGRVVRGYPDNRDKVC